jgi:hypothetical protein
VFTFAERRASTMSSRQRKASRHDGVRAANHTAGLFVAHAPQGRTDDANAFIPDPDGGPAHTDDDLAENMAEEFIEAATRGNEVAEEVMDEVVPEEMGGPFVETSAAEEFATDTDESNPLDAEPEPLPRPVAGLIQLPGDGEEEDEG